MLAIIGASGLLGEALVEALHGLDWLEDEPKLFATDDSIGKRISFGDRTLAVSDVEKLDWSQVKTVVLAVPADAAMKYRPLASEHGCQVLDFSDVLLSDSDVASLQGFLVAAEATPAIVLNSETVRMPAADVWQALMVLQPLAQAYGLKRVEVVNLLPVSSTGRAGVNELARQTGNLLNARDIDANLFPQQIAFNSVSLGDTQTRVSADGERAAQLAQLLGLAESQVAIRSIWTSVFFGLSQCLSFELLEACESGSTGLIATLESAGIVEWNAGQVGTGPDVEFVTNPVAVANTRDLFASELRASDEAGHCWGLNTHADNLRFALNHLALPILKALHNSAR